MTTYRCFLCGNRIGKRHAIYSVYFDVKRHSVRLCGQCGIPDFVVKDEEWMADQLLRCEEKLKQILVVEGV